MRAFEHPKTGTLFLEFSEPTRTGSRPQVKRIALGHRDTERATGQAEELAAEIRKGEPPQHEPATLGMLFDNYLKEVTSQYTTSKHDHDYRAAALFLRGFGAEREARSLSRREWDHFIKERRSGKLAPLKKKKPRRAAVKKGTRPTAQPPKAVKTNKPRPVRSSIIARDLEFLRAVLNWATMASDGKGGVLLERNPLKGLPLPREESPVRVRMDEKTYPTMLAKAPEKDPKKPCRTDVMVKWWGWVEALAQITHVKRCGWHALRRAFATELKHVPLKDRCELGGWKEPTTVLTCYMQADQDTMRKALESRTRIAASGAR